MMAKRSYHQAIICQYHRIKHMLIRPSFVVHQKATSLIYFAHHHRYQSTTKPVMLYQCIHRHCYYYLYMNIIVIPQPRRGPIMSLVTLHASASFFHHDHETQSLHADENEPLKRHDHEPAILPKHKAVDGHKYQRCTNRPNHRVE